MPIKPKYYNTDKVTIDDDIQDLLRYSYIVSIVDNLEFITRLRAIRKTLDLSNLMSRHDADIWLNKVYNLPESKYRSELDHLNFKKRFALGLFIDDICNIFKLNFYYRKILQYSVLTGTILNSDFPTSYSYCLPYGELNTSDILETEIDSPLVAILITPDVTKEELCDLFDDKAVPLFEKMLSKQRSLRVKLKPNIREHREWYWQRLLGKSNDRIAKDNIITKQGVINAFKDYERLILEGVTYKPSNEVTILSPNNI